MASRKKPSAKSMSRGKFLGFLSKVGILGFLASIPAFGADKFVARESEEDKTIRRFKSSGVLLARRVQSPMIKGKLLSETALTAKLATRNLEKLRDLLTGRFFGKVAESAFRNGYTPLINWNLGAEGSDSGCLFHARLDDGSGFNESVDNCGIKVIGRMEGEHLFIDIYSISQAVLIDPGAAGWCPGYDPCPSQCDTRCGSLCEGQCAQWCSAVCNPQTSIDMIDIVSYPADKFASEIMEILETTDVGVIQSELKQIIFSDEVLNMGLRQFVLSSHAAMIEGIERTV